VAVGERVALGGGGGEGGAGTGRRAAAGGGGQEGAHTGGRGVLEVLLQVGAFNIENAPRCILVSPYTVFIYYTYIYGGALVGHV
jgi:hypothetical protein